MRVTKPLESVQSVTSLVSVDSAMRLHSELRRKLLSTWAVIMNSASTVWNCLVISGQLLLALHLGACPNAVVPIPGRVVGLGRNQDLPACHGHRRHVGNAVALCGSCDCSQKSVVARSPRSIFAYSHPATWVIPALVGCLLAVSFELWAVYAVQRWQYGIMPLIPVIRVGVTPVLQMVACRSSPSSRVGACRWLCLTI